VIVFRKETFFTIIDRVLWIQIFLMTSSPDHGAFVISLDLELFWGVRDHIESNEHYFENLHGEREAVHAILKIFAEYEIAATWAAVGIIFAESDDDCRRLTPSIIPQYANTNLSPYSDLSPKGIDRSLLYAPDIIDSIKRTPRQEIATHTFSHFYCMESGQTPEAFRADIGSAIRAANERSVEVRSIVFPRNQHNPDYDQILIDNGISCYRGNQRSRLYQFGRRPTDRPYYRAARLADTFLKLSGHNITEWNSVWKGEIADVPASMFLRPVTSDKGLLNRIQLRRLVKCMEDAANTKGIFHLWWHPHNFGLNLEPNIEFLRKILESFRVMHDRGSIRSMSMAEVADRAPRTFGKSRS